MNRNALGTTTSRVFGALLALALALTLAGCGAESRVGISPGDMAGEPPENVQAQAGDSKVAIRWDSVSDATGYHLYYATESIDDIDNHGSIPGAELVLDVTSPYTVTGLENGTIYYFRVTALNGQAESAGSEQVTATPQPFMPVGGLNDTGVVTCAPSSGASLPCYSAAVASYPGQDAVHGRDAQARDDQNFQKIGAGAAGFDFTRLCGSGATAGFGECPENPTPGDGPNDWACTRDNVTGLIWEVKLDDAGQLRHGGHTYTWYNTDPDTNGGDAGRLDGGTCAGSACDTQAYVAAINALNEGNGLCGVRDWRLPDRVALQSVVHYGRSSGPALDTEYFPNMMVNQYWSAATLASRSDLARAILNWTGAYNSHSKDGAAHGVRLVAGGEPLVGGATTCAGTENSHMLASTPTADFVDHGDGTVTHTPTGLMWKRCVEGQTWNSSNNTCGGGGGSFNWQQALQRAQTVNASDSGAGFAGHNDWRLPNVKELLSITEQRCAGGVVNAVVFPGLTGSVWTSTPYSANDNNAWKIDVGANVTRSLIDGNNRTLLVRAAQ
ncbi:DUF1566 domain-containing protein [Alcanivorax sp. JB21]|uniref:Lcl C-terminal domain-containing protein n=1 Tax=Alcanivorax limicola TaxID=2874102 RepID=UPI001CBF96A9|nr:DUF1566 domain-containing protein [Alcanivorax limicola]MBZ2189930.1 DUF1566 domain-containing protein [Alcanivorax limicola]